VTTLQNDYQPWSEWSDAMELKYYILTIDTNRHIVNKKLFLSILQDFNVIYATFQEGQCKALCEDNCNLKMFYIYQESNNTDTYNEVYIEKLGPLPELLDYLINEDRNVLIDFNGNGYV
jgi:hypothetical protein